ncbi:MAG: hypothetical protein U0531_08935 [Dehalococcoidia bacterium]
MRRPRGGERRHAGELTTLVDRSLVQADHRGGEVRYRLLETPRAYALERLTALGEVERLERRRLAHFLALAETARPELFRADNARWLARLAEEHDNLRAALAWALTGEDGPSRRSGWRGRSGASGTSAATTPRDGRG